MSAKVNEAQKNYTVTDLESYATMLSVEKFRPYTEGLRLQSLRIIVGDLEVDYVIKQMYPKVGLSYKFMILISTTVVVIKMSYLTHFLVWT